jgi:hypothetical protein
MTCKSNEHHMMCHCADNLLPNVLNVLTVLTESSMLVLENGLWWRAILFPIQVFCESPTLLYKIQFTVIFWQKDHTKSSWMTCGLKIRFHICKISLSIHQLPAAAVRFSTRTFEFSALSREMRCICVTTLKSNQPCHVHLGSRGAVCLC